MDSDYCLIGMENNTSTCITNNIRHFIGPLRPINNRAIKGYGVVIKVRGEGMFKWNSEEDVGQIHSIIIHKVNYVTESPISCSSYNIGINTKITIIPYLGTYAPTPDAYTARQALTHVTFFVVETEEDLNLKYKEHVCFETILVSDYGKNVNEDLLRHRNIWKRDEVL